MEKKQKPAVYAVKHKDLATRMASRSGGIFTALSDIVLNEGGVIYGCVLTDTLDAVHVRAESEKQRDRMRGSKYIQSQLGDTFRQVREDLCAGRKVLFSGTSCQVAGLHAFLGKEYDDLLCLDIVCHGVPSPMVWHDYVQWQEERAGGRCVAVDFRNKQKYPWEQHVETLTMSLPSGETKTVDSEVFKDLFYGHRILRPACYRCPYKDIYHPGNITIADYWGIDQAAPDYNDHKGVSLVLVNDALGMNYFDRCKDKIDWRECRIEDSMQPPLEAPFPAPADRAEFWRAYRQGPFARIAKKYGRPKWKERTRIFLRRTKKQVKKLLLLKK